MRVFIPALAVAVTAAGAAQAGLEFCNRTDERQSLSVGYKAGGEWVSEGWWLIAPGECRTPLKDELTNRYYYFRATASGGVFDSDSVFFCTRSEPYTIRGQDDYAGRGYRREGFRKIDTGKSARHFTLTLTPPEGSGAGKSSEAAPEPEPAPDPAAPVSVWSSGLGQGQHGEPFSERVMFQGCDIIDGLEACAFHANGWKYFAFYDDPTPSAFLRRLEALPVNMPMALSGDLVSYGDSSAVLALSTVEPLPGSDPYAGQRAAMQGSWVSADDPGYTLYIHGSEMHEYYNGEFQDTMFLDLRPDCPDSAGAGPVLIQTSQQHRDTYCYLIDNLAGGWMDLIFMGHEAMLSFRKVE